MPVFVNTFGECFNGFIQRADLIADSRLVDQNMGAFEDVAIASDLDDCFKPNPLVCIR